MAKAKQQRKQLQRNCSRRPNDAATLPALPIPIPLCPHQQVHTLNTLCQLSAAVRDAVRRVKSLGLLLPPHDASVVHKVRSSCAEVTYNLEACYECPTASGAATVTTNCKCSQLGMGAHIHWVATPRVLSCSPNLQQVAGCT